MSIRKCLLLLFVIECNCVQPPAPSAPTTADDYDDDEDTTAPKSTATIAGTDSTTTTATLNATTSAVDAQASGADAVATPSDSDKALMPPPSAPSKSQLNYEASKSDDLAASVASVAAGQAGSDSSAATTTTTSAEPAETTNADAPAPATVSSENSASPKATETASSGEKKLETPLAAMLPSKYANIDVRELFPDFRPDKVLRFSRLFGPGKPSSLPQIWRSVRKRRNRRKHSRDGDPPFGGSGGGGRAGQHDRNSSRQRDGGSDSTSESDERSSETRQRETSRASDAPKRSGFAISEQENKKPPTATGANANANAANSDDRPTADQIASDDEDRLLSERADPAKVQADQDHGDAGDQKPKIADWRYGPAQVWYDMLDVADSGEGFNYGFKLRDRAPDGQGTVHDAQDEVVVRGEPIPDDAYLMVSQLHWEDDVVWDGNDIKHKVMQKLNSKTNAAGWLPSSGSRTAGAFSQPGKGGSIGGGPGASGGGGSGAGGSSQGGGSKSGGGGSKMSKAQLLLQKQEEVDDTWYSIFPVENEELVYSKWEEEVIWDAEAMVRIPKPKVLTLDPNDENIILGIPDDIDPSKVIKNTRPPPKVKIPHPHVKKSKILLGKAGVINVLAEDTPPPPPKSPDRDPFNISNDM